MRLPLIVATVLVSACSSAVEFKDTNAAVDANPECINAEGRPGEATAPWCKRELRADWTTGSDKGEKIDFSGKKDDDDR